VPRPGHLCAELSGFAVVFPEYRHDLIGVELASPAGRPELRHADPRRDPAGQEQQAFDAISLSCHPDAASVLSLIGRHHPDKRIAKAARRSAFKAPSDHLWLMLDFAG
jgi:hypothetical protein